MIWVGERKLESKDYKEIVVKAFKILKIKLPEKKDLDNMLETLKEVANGPIMSESEISVHDQIRELVRGIQEAKSVDNVREILAGRNILFPGPDDPACMAQAAYHIVHKGKSVKEVINGMKEYRGKDLGMLTPLT